MNNENLLLETLKSLRSSIERMEVKVDHIDKKSDTLRQYITDHRNDEQINLAVIRERLILLEERGRVANKKWGFIATVATSVLTVIIATYIKLFYGAE